MAKKSTPIPINKDSTPFFTFIKLVWHVHYTTKPVICQVFWGYFFTVRTIASIFFLSRIVCKRLHGKREEYGKDDSDGIRYPTRGDQAVSTDSGAAGAGGNTLPRVRDGTASAYGRADSVAV